MNGCFHLPAAALAFALLATSAPAAPPEGEGWISIFNGKDLEGWKLTEENPASFRVDEGAIIAHGPRAHLFFDGEGAADLVDFELFVRVKTESKANSGIFFHTSYQPQGWPAQGYEAQVNATHDDRRKTGSLWSVADILDEAPHKDGEWFDYLIRVEGKKVTVSINGKVVNEFTEPDDPGHPKRRLSKGTIALQAHDPDSVALFKDLHLRRLP